MSQATTEPTTPTTGDVLARVGETLAALQDAEQTCVEAARKLYEHTQDGNAHGAGLQENIGREMPRPVWQGTALAFQKADGTTVAEAVDLKGRKGDRGEAGPRPEHRWDGTCLTVQSADGSWPENGVDLKGEKGDRGDIGPRPEHRWDGTRLTVQNADGSWPESGVDLKGEKGDAGEVSLADAVDSDSSTTAASSLAVKTAYDAATAAQSAADAAQATATAAGETADAAKQAAATLAGRFDGSGKILPANLPLATTAALGAVRIGGGLSVTAQGLLAASCLIQSRRAATTLYVRADGDDSRDGLTAQTSLKTVRRAWQRMKELDTAHFEVTIDVGAGTFDVSGLELGRTTLSSPRATLRGQGAATVLNVSSGYFGFTVGAWWRIDNLKILLAKDTFVNNTAAYLTFVRTTFAVSGVSTEPHLAVAFAGTTSLDSGCAFTGASSCAVSADAGGVVRILGDISINGSFSLATMACGGGSLIRRAESTLPTISGTSTGCRYSVGANGTMQSAGGGPNWIPGSKAGVATNGGIYI